MRHGFKAWCERQAADHRAELGLGATAPLSMRKLAQKLGVRVWYPREIPKLPARVLDAIGAIEDGAWSAATLVHGQKKLVLLNERHPVGRQANDLAHELSHLICRHTPSQTRALENGLMMVTEYDDEQEEEADLLGAILLLPRVALLAIMEASMSESEAAALYGVSTELLRMRMQRAGVTLQFRRRGLLRQA